MATGGITLAWADGEHAFNCAKIGLVLELEEKCGCGIMEIYSRIIDKRWRFSDIREPIRLGLIGGGKTPAQALALTRRYVDDRPFAESVQTAELILMAALVGHPEESVGKKKPEAMEPETTENSGDQSYTGPPPPSDLPQEKPTP